VIHHISQEQKHNSNSVISLVKEPTPFYIGMVFVVPVVTILSQTESILSTNPSVISLVMTVSSCISTRPVLPAAHFLYKASLNTAVASSATILVLPPNSLLGTALVLPLVIILMFRPLFKEDYTVISLVKTPNMPTGMEPVILPVLLL